MIIFFWSLVSVYWTCRVDVWIGRCTMDTMDTTYIRGCMDTGYLRRPLKIRGHVSSRVIIQNTVSDCTKPCKYDNRLTDFAIVKILTASFDRTSYVDTCVDGWMDGMNTLKKEQHAKSNISVWYVYVVFFGCTTYQTRSITITLYCHGPQMWPALLPFTTDYLKTNESFPRGPKSLLCFHAKGRFALGFLRANLQVATTTRA